MIIVIVIYIVMIISIIVIIHDYNFRKDESPGITVFFLKPDLTYPEKQLYINIFI